MTEENTEDSAATSEANGSSQFVSVPRAEFAEYLMSKEREKIQAKRQERFSEYTSYNPTAREKSGSEVIEIIQTSREIESILNIGYRVWQFHLQYIKIQLINLQFLDANNCTF